MITQNAVKDVVAGKKLESFTVQIIEIKKMQDNNIVLIVSDKTSYIDALLNQSYLAAVDDRIIKENQLIMIDDYTIANINGRISMNIISLQPGKIIEKEGKPSPVKSVFDSENQQYVPISALSTFMQDWTLRAKIIKKNDIHEYTNKKTGKTEKVMSITLLDCEESQIHGSFFGDAIEKFESDLEVGKIYLFSDGSLHLNDQKYRETSSNYRITFNTKSTITLAPNQFWSVSNPEKSIIHINEISNMPEKSSVNIAGIILEISQLFDIVNRKGQNLTRRMLKIVDTSNTSIELSLWNEFSKDFILNSVIPSSTVIIAKGVSISNFNGELKLNTSQYHTELLYDPDIPLTGELKGWFNNSSQGEIKSIELTEKKDRKIYDIPLKSIEELKTFQPDQTQRYEIIGHSKIIKKDEVSLTYPSCQVCKKKVTEESTGYYHCSSCQKTSKDCIHKFLLRSLLISDFSGTVYGVAFNEVGELLFQMKAQEFFNKSEDDKKELISMISLRQHSFIMKVSSSVGQDGVTRMEYIVTNANYVKHNDVTKKILALINSSLP